MVLVGELPPLGASCLLPAVSSEKDPRVNGAQFFLELGMGKKATFLMCPHESLPMDLPLQSWLQELVHLL